MACFSYHVKPAWFPAAPAFMDGCFLISGFLIMLVLHKNIARTGTLQLARFWKWRLLRLYPALMAMVTVYCVIAGFWVHYTLCGCALGLPGMFVVARLLALDYFVWQQSLIFASYREHRTAAGLAPGELDSTYFLLARAGGDGDTQLRD